jgi:hypothetical protein
MWTGAVVSTDILAHVADDPRIVMQVQCDDTIAQTQLGLNFEVNTYAAGNTNLGKSAISVDSTTPATTSTFPLRSIDFVDGPDSSVGDAATDLLVIWNADVHQYDLALGT